MSDSNIVQVHGSNEVRDRLLDVAELHFSEKGYDSTSVRDLTTAAGCNLAAVNYHFGHKSNLYHQVFLRRCTNLREIRLKSINKALSDSSGKPSLDNLLRLFANAFVEPLIADSVGRRFLRLAIREMLNPRLPQDIFLSEVINPVMAGFQDALLRICPYLTKTKAYLCAQSVVGQLIQIVHMRAMFDSLGPDYHLDFDLTTAVDHIVEFSANAIKAYEKDPTPCA